MAPGQDDIAELITRVALRDRRAFALLYERTAPKLHGVCLRILRDRTRAEDALQDVYVKVWRGAATFAPGRASAMTWLIAIARHHAIDVMRARVVVEDELDTAGEVADAGPDPEHLAIAAGERRRIDACLDELKPERAEALKAAYVEGYSYEELARRFAVPLNTMRTWLRRGLMSLRECLERR